MPQSTQTLREMYIGRRMALMANATMPPEQLDALRNWTMRFMVSQQTELEMNAGIRQVVLNRMKQERR